MYCLRLGINEDAYKASSNRHARHLKNVIPSAIFLKSTTIIHVRVLTQYGSTYLIPMHYLHNITSSLLLF